MYLADVARVLGDQEVLNDLAFLEHVLGEMEDSDIQLREGFDAARPLLDVVVYTVVGELKAMRFYSGKPPSLARFHGLQRPARRRWSARGSCGTPSVGLSSRR